MTTDPQPIPYRNEVLRKALHLLALVVPLSLTWLGKAALPALFAMALAALGADWLRVRSAGFARLVDVVFGRMMRASERPPLGGPVVVNGATWVLLSVALLGLIFPVRIAAAAFSAFMVADAAAALIGRRYGKHEWFGGPRTMEGSAAFLAAGLLVMAVWPGIAPWTGIPAVVAMAVAEIPSGPFNDNIRVPFVGAVVLFVLERFTLGADIGLFLTGI